MKTCTKCNEAKALACFSRQAKGRYGVTSICKACTSERGKAWHRENRERSLLNKAVYRALHPEKVRAGIRAWQTANAEREQLRSAAWSANNPDKKRAATAKRRASKARAMPAWASLGGITRFYVLAAKLTRETGIKAHVDHVVPIQSPLVCGLHCEANLTIVTERQNKSKGNRWWPDMPE